MLLRTEAAVGSAVAVSAVTHLLAGVVNHPTRPLVLTGVHTAHWTHQGAQCLNIYYMNIYAQDFLSAQ